MAADQVRMDAYRRALEQTIREGASVLDLGAGTGIMTILACRLGAGRVIAIEPNNLLAVAREMVRAAGWESRVELINETSTAVAAPRPCDVVVSDLRGVLPLYGQHIPAVRDARTRWLAEGGMLIPRQDTIYAAVVESAATFEEQYGGWLHDADGIPFDAARWLCANQVRKVYLQEEEQLSAATPWTTLDYRTVKSTDHAGEVALEIGREGTGHGLALWFEATLTEGVELSNRPGRPPMIYGQLFLPWPRPIALRAGDEVRVRLRADLVGDRYVWSWTSLLPRGGSPSAAPLRFDQSTFLGQTWTRESLSRMKVSGRPELTAKGRAAAAALHAMDGVTPTDEIAGRLTAEFPAEFPDARHAIRFVSSLRAEFCR